MRSMSMVMAAGLAAGCMTDAAGNSCPSIGVGDGTCPDNGGPDLEEGPRFHGYGEPHFIDLGGESSVLTLSSGHDYVAYEEFPSGAHLTTPTSSIRPAIACGDVCIAAWQDSNKVLTSVRSANGWSQPVVHEAAIQSAAVAALNGRLFVAWESLEGVAGARVELRRIEPDGSIGAQWTVARGVDHGHLSLAASAGGALLTWQRVGESGYIDGTFVINAWVVAQAFAIDGAPTGIPFEHRVNSSAGAYYEAAPSAFVDGAYRVTHEILSRRGTWLVVDPVARTVREEMIGELTFPRRIRAIVPLGEGAVLAMSDAHTGVIARVEDDRIVNDVFVGEGPGVPAVARTSTGIRVAYADDGSLFVEDRTDNLAGVNEPTLVAERYELPSAGGCSVSHAGRNGLAPLAFALLALVRRRRHDRAR